MYIALEVCLAAQNGTTNFRAILNVVAVPNNTAFYGTVPFNHIIISDDTQAVDYRTAFYAAVVSDNTGGLSIAPGSMIAPEPTQTPF